MGSAIILTRKPKPQHLVCRALNLFIGQLSSYPKPRIIVLILTIFAVCLLCTSCNQKEEVKKKIFDAIAVSDLSKFNLLLPEQRAADFDSATYKAFLDSAVGKVADASGTLADSQGLRVVIVLSRNFKHIMGKPLVVTGALGVNLVNHGYGNFTAIMSMKSDNGITYNPIITSDETEYKNTKIAGRQFLVDFDATYKITGFIKGDYLEAEKVELIAGGGAGRGMAIPIGRLFPSTENIIDVKIEERKTIEMLKSGQKWLHSIEQNMVTVSGGNFIMGNTHWSYDPKNPMSAPVQVNSFKISKYDVTQALWLAVMGKNPSTFRDCDDCPVEHVSWDDVEEFINKLNLLTHLRYRLPTEAEWEYAARGGKQSKGYTYSGSNDVGKVAWYIANSGGSTHPVGQKQPNELGLYDMSGNVMQWCSDWYDSNYYKHIRYKNPTGPSTGKTRVLRGFSWHEYPDYGRVFDRMDSSPDNPGEAKLGWYLGFRLAQDL